MIQKILVIVFTLFIVTPLYAETVSEYLLSNGLKLIVKEDHRAPIVLSQVWYKVGASYELNGITGISHMLEHMMFRGTKKYGPGVLKKIIADNGGNINAGTNDDYTVYYETVSVDKLPIVFRLESDRMHGLLLDKKAFKKEQQVVIEERRLRTEDNPQMRTYERFQAAAHISNPYHHPVIGWMSDIENLTPTDLRHWYKSWYTPNNAILVVVGDVNPKEVYKLAKKYFGHLKTKSLPQLKPYTTQQPLGQRTVIVNAHAKLPWLIMGYNVPTLKTCPKEHKWEAYALEMIACILDGGNSARLPKELIREKQIAVTASASYPLYQRLDGLLILEGTPSENQSIKQLQKAFLNQITKLQHVRVTQKELDRIKTQIIAHKTYAKDAIAQQAEEIGRLEVIGIPWQKGDHYIEQIKAITPEQIQTVAKKYLISDRLTIGILKPIK